MWGAIPDFPPLWESRPNRVTREEDWIVARMLSGTQQARAREEMFPLSRWEVRWALLVPLLGAYPVVRLSRAAFIALRTRRRRAAGLCIACGYNLQASPDRCPECGASAGTTTPPAGGIVGVP
jgi:hypothetical protein